MKVYIIYLLLFYIYIISIIFDTHDLKEAEEYKQECIDKGMTDEGYNEILITTWDV